MLPENLAAGLSQLPTVKSIPILQRFSLSHSIPPNPDTRSTHIWPYLFHSCAACSCFSPQSTPWEMIYLLAPSPAISAWLGAIKVRRATIFIQLQYSADRCRRYVKRLDLRGLFHRDHDKCAARSRGISMYDLLHLPHPSNVYSETIWNRPQAPLRSGQHQLFLGHVFSCPD